MSLGRARLAGAVNSKQMGLTHERTTAKPARHVPQRRRKNKTPLTIFLVNGVKLQGIHHLVRQFLRAAAPRRPLQLVYKHAISTVMPSVPVQLFEQEQEVAAEGLIWKRPDSTRSHNGHANGCERRFPPGDCRSPLYEGRRTRRAAIRRRAPGGGEGPRRWPSTSTSSRRCLSPPRRAAPATLIGKGKVEEIKALCDEDRARSS